MGPLESGLQHAANPPIRIAEMIVDRWIFRLELNRTLELFGRFLVIAESVVGPAERVDDVAVVRALLDSLFDHLHAFVQLDALVNPRITKVVEDVWLVGE